MKEEHRMERRISSQKAEHSRAIEAAYQRGYHHGLTQAMDLIFGLLSSGIPTSTAADLCRVFVIWPIRPANEIGNAKLSISFAGQLRGKLCLFSPAPNGS